MQSSKLGGILIFAFLIIGGLLLLRREPAIASTPLYLKSRQETEPERITGGRRSAQTEKAGAKEYSNEERWSIRWNDEGLPIEVVIHRHAMQS